MRNTNCKNCGAPLDWTKSKCEYCGTFFTHYRQEIADLILQSSYARLAPRPEPKKVFFNSLIQAGAFACHTLFPYPK